MASQQPDLVPDQWKIGASPAVGSSQAPLLAPNFASTSKPTSQMMDVQQGINEFRSIQDTVQLTFQAFFDALRTQGDAIKSLEKSRDQLAVSLRTEMAAALRGKVQGSDLAGRLTEFESQLHRKADLTDVERRPLRTEVEASLRTQMSDVVALLKAKQEESVSKAWQQSCERQLAALKTDVCQLQASVEEVKVLLSSKANAAEVNMQLASKADEGSVDERLRTKVSKQVFGEVVASKVNEAVLERALCDVRARMSDIEACISRKADSTRAEEVARGLERLSNRQDADVTATSTSLQELGTRFDAAIASQSGALQDTQMHADRLVAAAREDAQMQLAEVANRQGAAIARKADTSEVARLLAETRAEVAGLRDAMATRASVSLLTAVETKVAQLSHLPAQLTSVARELSETVAAGQAQLGSTLDKKANVVDVNTALEEVCRDLSSRAPVEHLDRLAVQCQQLSSALAAQANMGRWLWKSGALLQGGQVPWELQAMNASPAHLVWEAGQAAVITVIPGLYRLTFVLFCAKRPVVQVLINAEPILTLAAAPQFTFTAAPAVSMNGQQGPGHSAGNVLGVSCCEHLSLPGHAQITVRVQGEAPGAEGFLQLQKL